MTEANTATCPTCKEPVTCPDCGGSIGVLGTSYAYFICPNHEPHERYWLGGYPYTMGLTWKDAVLAAPHGRCGSGKQFFEENV